MFSLKIVCSKISLLGISCFSELHELMNTINFIMGIDKLDFIEASKKLGQMYNIHIESTNHNSKTSNL